MNLENTCAEWVKPDKKTTYCMSLFIWNAQNKQIYKDRGWEWAVLGCVIQSGFTSRKMGSNNTQYGQGYEKQVCFSFKTDIGFWEYNDWPMWLSAPNLPAPMSLESAHYTRAHRPTWGPVSPTRTHVHRAVASLRSALHCLIKCVAGWQKWQ